MSSLQFRTINLERDFQFCLQLRAVSYQASYGTMDGFDAHYGDEYRSRLSERVRRLPEGNCHLWYNGQIVGQTEAKETGDETVGYINLLVLKPDFQRRGFGTQMIEYLRDCFRQHNKTMLQLSVSPGNQSALDFYHATGWQLMGPRPDKPSMYLMQKAIHE